MLEQFVYGLLIGAGLGLTFGSLIGRWREREKLARIGTVQPPRSKETG